MSCCGQIAILESVSARNSDVNNARRRRSRDDIRPIIPQLWIHRDGFRERRRTSTDGGGRDNTTEINLRVIDRPPRIARARAPSDINALSTVTGSRARMARVYRACSFDDPVVRRLRPIFMRSFFFFAVRGLRGTKDNGSADSGWNFPRQDTIAYFFPRTRCSLRPFFFFLIRSFARFSLCRRPSEYGVSTQPALS